MMRGRVDGLKAEIAVPFVLSDRPGLSLEFVVDTGFTGELMLSEAAVSALGLRWIRTITANLADDSEIDIDQYAANVLWHGEEITVSVLAAGKRPLLGTTLLAGSSLYAEFVDAGEVRIESVDD
jgi:clan AA aspartic protease